MLTSDVAISLAWGMTAGGRYYHEPWATRCPNPQHVSPVGPEALQPLTERTFATNRNLVPKGMLEVVP